MKTDSRIYIAGHEGLVGQALVKKLEKSGYRNLMLATRENLDLTVQKDVESYFSKMRPEYVVLLAAKMGGIEEKIKYPAEFLFENMMIQNNILWAAHKHNVTKLLFMGSAAAYPLNTQQPIKEGSLMTGSLSITEEPYALAKISGIKLCEKIHSEFNQNFISCMPTNIYGPGYKVGEGSGKQVIPTLIDRIHKAKTDNSKSVDIWGSGQAKRDFIYIEDLVSALLLLMRKYNDAEPINISNGQVLNIAELAKIIKKVIKFEGTLHFDTTKPEGVPIRVLDSERLTSLGFVPSVDIQSGVEKTYKYYLNILQKKHV